MGKVDETVLTTTYVKQERHASYDSIISTIVFLALFTFHN